MWEVLGGQSKREAHIFFRYPEHSVGVTVENLGLINKENAQKNAF